MELYKVTLELESSLITPLKGDTIWGHVVWGIANHEGEEAVNKFLSDCKTSESPFVVSSAFPHNMLCKPMPPVQKRQKEMTPAKYAEIKKNKKSIYINSSLYLEQQNEKENEKITKVFESVEVTHNTMNRFSNTVNDGGLFAVSEQWATVKLFDIYIVSSYEKNRVKQLLDWAFENGFGADASVGKGKITVVGEPESIKTKCKSNSYMALGPFVLPENSEITDLKADIFVRTGKIGGAFASFLQPWKKTVVLFNEGAIFSSDKPISFIGKMLTDIHSDSRICQSGFAPVIPISDSME